MKLLMSLSGEAPRRGGSLLHQVGELSQTGTRRVLRRRLMDAQVMLLFII